MVLSRAIDMVLSEAIGMSLVRRLIWSLVRRLVWSLVSELIQHTTSRAYTLLYLRVRTVGPYLHLHAGLAGHSGVVNGEGESRSCGVVEIGPHLLSHGINIVVVWHQYGINMA